MGKKMLGWGSNHGTLGLWTAHYHTELNSPVMLMQYYIDKITPTLYLPGMNGANGYRATEALHEPRGK